MIYDEARGDFLLTELEPTLIEFLQHKSLPDDLHLIITWSLGKWRVGSKKKGKNGYFHLISEKGAKRGHYRLLRSQREKSKKPESDYVVIVVDQILNK